MRLSTLSCLIAAAACPLSALASVNFPVLGAQTNVAAKGKAPIPPSKDPFYKAPAGFEKKAPGTILRHRAVPHPLLVGPSLDKGKYKAAYQLLYRTTNGLGKPQAAVQTVIVPKNGDPKKLLSYQTFYDAADEDCSPSYTLQQGNPETNIEGVIMSVAIAQGWYLTISDYEGPNAAFTVGKQAGHATIDGIRATLNSRKFTDIAKSPRVAMFGYSGGALASEWAAELQPKYAPELKMVGAAFGGLTPNVTSVILSVNGQANSNLIPTGILGFANQYKNVSKYLKEELKPATAAEFRHPETHCSSPKLSNKNILNYFKKGSKSINAPIFKQTVHQNGQMGLTNTPTIPLYVYKSTGDEVSPVADTDKLVKKYCNDGASIEYIRNHYGTHETQFIISLPDAFYWLKDRFDGKAAAKKCSTTNTKASKMKKNAKKILGPLVYQELKAELSSMEGGK